MRVAHDLIILTLTFYLFISDLKSTSNPNDEPLRTYQAAGIINTYIRKANVVTTDYERAKCEVMLSMRLKQSGMDTTALTSDALDKYRYLKSQLMRELNPPPPIQNDPWATEKEYINQFFKVNYPTPLKERQIRRKLAQLYQNIAQAHIVEGRQLNADKYYERAALQLLITTQNVDLQEYFYTTCQQIEIILRNTSTFFLSANLYVDWATSLYSKGRGKDALRVYGLMFKANNNKGKLRHLLTACYYSFVEGEDNLVLYYYNLASNKMMLGFEDKDFEDLSDEESFGLLISIEMLHLALRDKMQEVNEELCNILDTILNEFDFQSEINTIFGTIPGELIKSKDSKAIYTYISELM